MKLSKIDRLVLRAKKKTKDGKNWVRYCPKCKSTDVALYGQLVESGFWYYCRKCFYHASSFPEKAKRKTNRKSREELLAKMLSIIRKKPGIRPSELNRLLNRGHSWGLRSTLIKRGLIRKERKGAAVRYYPQTTSK